MIRLYGFVPDRPGFCHDGHVCDSGLLQASPSSLPSSFVQTGLGPETVQDSNDCVGNAIPVAMRDRMILQGTVDPTLPSRRRVYLLARLLEIAERLGIGGTAAERCRGALDAIAAGRAVLLDAGCIPELAIASFNEIGWCAERFWPYTSTSANDLGGPLEAESKAYDQRGKLRAHVWSTVEQAKVLLVGGVTLPIGGLIGKAYENPPDGTVIRFDGNPVGGHMRRIIGWDDSIGAFREGGSWGDGPRFTAYEDIVDPEVTQSRLAIDFVPSPTEDNPLAGSVNHV